MPKVLVLSFLNTQNHSRAGRNIEALSKFFHVQSMAYDPIQPTNSLLIPLSKGVKAPVVSSPKYTTWRLILIALLSRLNLPGAAYWKVHPGVLEGSTHYKELADVDIFFVNGIEPLPLALHLANGRPVVLDLHDYPPDHLEPGSVARLAFQPLKYWLYFAHVGKATIVFSPGEDMRKVLNSEFPGLETRVVRNTPARRAAKLSLNRRAAIKLVHHGSFHRTRGVVQMLEALQRLPDTYTLDFIFQQSPPRWFVKRIQGLGLNHRVRFLEPVSPADIPSRLQEFDLALIWTQPTNRNNRLVVPGKFFEAMHAGLAIVCSPTHELKSIVEERRIGRVAHGFSAKSLIEAIHSIDLSDLRMFQRNAAAAADIFCWQEEGKVLLNSVNSIAQTHQ